MYCGFKQVRGMIMKKKWIRGGAGGFYSPLLRHFKNLMSGTSLKILGLIFIPVHGRLHPHLKTIWILQGNQLYMNIRVYDFRKICTKKNPWKDAIKTQKTFSTAARVFNTIAFGAVTYFGENVRPPSDFSIVRACPMPIPDDTSVSSFVFFLLSHSQCLLPYSCRFQSCRSSKLNIIRNL